MNNVDKQYLELLQDILDNGVHKETRSGAVRSVFGRTMRFNLQDGLPLLTTKKVFVKGIIHELLWFLKGDTNIKYLVDNNVHIWTEDALRWFRKLNFNKLNRKYFDDNEEEIYYHGDYIFMDLSEMSQNFYLRFPNSEIREKLIIETFQKNITKELFEEYVKKEAYIERCDVYEGKERNHHVLYHFGELGDVYGKQWRKFGVSNRDQIQNIIDTLKTNPDDRRMILTGWNPDVLEDVALPACHIFASFWTRELSNDERIGVWFQKYNLNEEIFLNKKSDLKEHSKEYNLFGDYFYRKTLSKEELINVINNEYDIPKRALSCSFTMRSNDYMCGWNFNVASYSLLTYMMCEICNMIPDEIVYNGLDIHVYENHIENAKIQLKRKGYDELPKLKFKRQINNINDFKYDDFEIIDYKSDEPIKFELNVG